MRLFLIFLTNIAPAVWAAALDRRTGCNADNCARAVTGTAAGLATLSTHISQCSSYFSTIVVPPTKTIYSPIATSYVFSSVASTPPIPASSPSTTITATNIPAYASTACDGNATPIPVRYSSACSCAGVTHVTSIAPSPTTTVGYTTTVTVSSFLILASGVPLPTPEYLTLGNVEGLAVPSETITFTENIASAISFDIDGNQLQLVNDGDLSNGDPNTSPLFFNSASTISSYGFEVVAVTIDQSLSVTLRNQANGYSFIEDCSGVLSVGQGPGGSNELGDSCSGELALTAVPL